MLTGMKKDCDRVQASQRRQDCVPANIVVENLFGNVSGALSADKYVTCLSVVSLLSGNVPLHR